MSRTFKDDRRGVSAVEFALILPILITALFGVLEFGLIAFTYNAANHAAWDVTRRLATNQIATTDVAADAVAELPSWVQPSATITPSASSSDPSTNQYTVTISFPAKAATPSNVLSWAYGAITLKVTCTMKQEPTS